MSISSMSEITEMAAMQQAIFQKDDQNRRSACDRCRRQKLRCERRPSATSFDPCKRCLKSRSKCVTGPSLPMGRPRIRTRSASPFDYRSVKRDFHPLVTDYISHVGPMRRDRGSPPVSSAGATALHEIPCSDMTNMNVLSQSGIPIIHAESQQKYGPDCGFNDYQTTCSSTSNTVVPPTNNFDDAVRSLQDLNSRLITLCQSLNTSSNSSPWSFADNNSLQPYGPYTSNSVETAAVSVSSLLNSSNEFLKIAQSLLFSPIHSTPVNSRHSSVDYTGMSYNSMGFQPLNQPQNAGRYSQNPSPVYDDRDSEFSPSSIPSLTSSVSTSTSPTTTRSLDFPTLLILLTSYATLLRIFRIILTRIHVVLLSQPMPWQSLEAIIPGLFPDGLATAQRPDSQVRLFVQLCKKTLEHVEKNVAYGTKLYNSGPDIDSASCLVDAMIKAEASEGAARIVSPKSIVDEILRTMDGGIGL